ncbi:hypothetical protein [Epilithonimonas zeae]|uniref:hypothetical protein n=1 Tax=Epilithonimonas zeae TaxID=1416779 RepID=UPI00200DC86C|nr:hypothetical protein [Epilithonimonas zeae]UQB69706.1 hypothetical protein KI430_04560 [Epilithonimonas zeae]
MKAFISIFIIFTIALRPVLPLVDYTVNYNYITKNLCENRAKKEMDCKGKCYLAKELSKSSQNSAKQDQLKLSVFSELFTVKDIFTVLSDFNFNLDNQKQNSFLSQFYNFSIESRIFHPPVV